MKRITVPAFAVPLAALLFCGAARAQVFDQIFLKTGKVFRAGERLTVVSETYAEVKWETDRGIQGALPQSKIREIMWGDKPSEYRNGEIARKRGKYNDAAKAYKKAVKSSVGRKWWIKPYSIYHLALCYRQAGQTAAAKEQYNRLITEYPKSKFYPNAHIALGKIALAVKDFDEALKKFEVVKASPAFDPDLTRLAWLRSIESLIGSKEYDNALIEANKLIPATETTHPDIALEARLKRALIKIFKDSRFDEGISEYRGLIIETIKRMESVPSRKEARLNRIVAQCYNGLGDAFLRHCKRRNRHKEALLEYLRVVTVLGEAVGQECAHALAGAAECFEAIGQKERAEALRKELKQRFGNK